MSESEKMSAEFGTVAEWTADAARALGPDHFVPAACRGSGGPAAMDWLLERLSGFTAPLLDVGAGIGGPAEYARQQRDATVVLAEPEQQACAAARSLFGSSAVRARADDLPFGTATFSHAWCLGVLCTVADHARVMTELARVVAPRGRVGMLVYARTQALSEQPEGNRFPLLAELPRLYEEHGFHVVEETALEAVASTPESWTRKESAVNAAIADRHCDDPAWQQSVAQESIMSDLLATGEVVGRLSALIRRGR